MNAATAKRKATGTLLMKGGPHSEDFLGAIVARATGRRTGRRLGHVSRMDVPCYHEPVMIIDATIDIASDREAGNITAGAA